MKRLVLFALVIASTLTLHAPAAIAEVDPRAEVTIQASPLECVLIHARVATQGTSVTSEETSDANARISKVCDFAGLEAKNAEAKVKKKAPDFAGPRVPRKIARDTLEVLVGYLVPTKERPVPIEQDAVLRTLRLELREVLAGRDPYASAKH